MLQKFGMSSCKSVSTPIDYNIYLTSLKDDSANPYYENQCRQIIGSLMYAALGTRPDICECVSLIESFSRKSKS